MNQRYSIRFGFSRSCEVRGGMVCALVASLWLVGQLSGCATAGASAESDDAERVVPPEVADSSVDDGRVDEPVVVPRVSVDLEAEERSGLNTYSARTRIERDGERCYRRALAAKKRLEGRAVYELLITSQGRVAGAEKVSTSAADRRLEQCLERAFRRLRFEMPPGDAALLSRMYVRFELRREVYEPGASPLGESGEAGR